MTDSTGPTRASDETREAERVHSVDPEVARHEEEMLKRGASQQGERRLP